MNISRRIEHLEARQQGGGESRIDASLLTDSELDQLMAKKHTGGVVLTQAYGPIKFEPQKIER